MPTEDPAPQPPNAPSEVVLLQEIRELLDRQYRRERQTDFSFLRLAGTLMQMLAVSAAIWGLLALFGDQSSAATARFALAAFLQLATLTAFYVDQQR
ncbi:MAG TPA: hypothetical protein VGM03_08550 [Phycisphaerae bacterium]|jgi:hypothetical protein